MNGIFNMNKNYQAKNLNIILHPDPRLRIKSRALSIPELLETEIQELLLDMALTMKNKDGAGLAAPQIGKNIQVVVLATDTKPIFMINPRLSKKSWAKEIEEEGCLSVLDEKGQIIYAPVARHKKISCLYLDPAGKPKKIQAEGVMARVIQHEIDHLNGILFLDRIDPKTKKTLTTSDPLKLK